MASRAVGLAPTTTPLTAPTTGLAASASSSARAEPGEGSTSEPWWKGHRYSKKFGKRRRLTPYELKDIVLPRGPTAPDIAQCIEFFPYTGPRRPKATEGWRWWDQWEDAAAYCCGDKIFVGQCTDGEGGPWRRIWEVRLARDKAEELYHVAWSIDPFTLHPLIITAGKRGLIYVLNVAERRIHRYLKGHGDEIAALAVAPTMPHILASGSRDRSIRIWNLFGADCEPLRAGELPNENYPMADADEGEVIVAVLCGGFPGGHESDVYSLAWHPAHLAIASGGADHQIKIWPLPPLPRPVRHPPPCPRSYRPHLVHVPMFSSARITLAIVDKIIWLASDILVVRTMNAIIVVQWMSYLRYFVRGQYEPQIIDHLDVPWPDINESHNFKIMSTLDIDAAQSYVRFGYHRLYTPRTDTQDDGSLVQTHLVAMPVEGRVPEVVLFAPHLGPSPSVPPFEVKLRYDPHEGILPDHESAPAASASQSSSDSSGKKRNKKRKTGSQVEPAPGELVAATPPPSSSEAEELDSDQEAHQEFLRRIANEETSKERDKVVYTWTLRAERWAEEVKRSRGKSFASGGKIPPIPPGDEDQQVIRCCDISPRGAKWIVGVGEWGALFVWRLRDVPKDKGRNGADEGDER